jgi:hypothetical protein
VGQESENNEAQPSAILKVCRDRGTLEESGGPGDTQSDWTLTEKKLCAGQLHRRHRHLNRDIRNFRYRLAAKKIKWPRWAIGHLPPQNGQCVKWPFEPTVRCQTRGRNLLFFFFFFFFFPTELGSGSG